MKLLFTILLIFLLVSCSSPKVIFVCGDHKCVNKDEAEQYFVKNLSIEVKIIDKIKKNKIDLVELNLKQNKNGSKEIDILNKKNTDKVLKNLSKKEVSRLKNNVKKRKRTKLRTIKPSQKNPNILYTLNKNTVDVCAIIEKCSISEITKYLLKQEKKLDFPDITRRQ